MSVTEQIKRKRDELEQLIADAKAKNAEAEQKGDAWTREEANALRALIEDGQAKRLDLTALLILDENDTFLHSPAGTGAKSQQLTPAQSAPTWGARVLDAPAYKALAARGEPITEREFPRLDLGGFKDMIGRTGRARKAIYEALGTAGGNLIVPDFRPDILDIARQQPPSFIDLVNRTTTNSDLVEYMLMDTRTTNAAVVTEYSGGAFGLKPESNRTFGILTAAVQTIAAWIGVSRQILNDQPRLRALIDNELTYEVELVLEATLIAGVLAWSGIQTRVHATSGRAFDAADTTADTLRRAITDLYLEFYQPDGIVLHPTQGENLELLKDDNAQYLRVYDSATMRIWRVPVLETPAMTSGSALVGAFRLAVTLWDREQTQVLTGQPNDYFLRNAFAILAELRAAYAVTRPKGVEKITGL